MIIINAEEFIYKYAYASKNKERLKKRVHEVYLELLYSSEIPSTESISDLIDNENDYIISASNSCDEIYNVYISKYRNSLMFDIETILIEEGLTHIIYNRDNSMSNVHPLQMKIYWKYEAKRNERQ